MVRHFLKDGKEVKSIDGRVVKIKEAQSIYTMINRINEKRRTK